MRAPTAPASLRAPRTPLVPMPSVAPDTLTDQEKRLWMAVRDNLPNLILNTQYYVEKIISSFLWDAEPKGRHRHTGKLFSQLVDRGLLPFKKVGTSTCNRLIYILAS